MKAPGWYIRIKSGDVVWHWLKLIAIMVPTALLVLKEQDIAILASERHAVFSIALFIFVAILLSPKMRHILIVSLSFGVGFLAIRDAEWHGPLPAILNTLLIRSVVYPFVWGSIAGLSLTAGAVESFSPGKPLTRRCYFAAAALYFTGHGFMIEILHPSNEGLVMCIIGLLAFVGFWLVPYSTISDEEAVKYSVSVNETDESVPNPILPPASPMNGLKSHLPHLNR
ncbi:MAG: hypothetical protein M1330_00015 [Armatimonadetes bacterium]|nr:hypothetical protein [Armatimonadota bacterium]